MFAEVLISGGAVVHARIAALCSIAVNGPGIVVALEQEVAVAGVDNGAESFLKHNVADVGLVVACRAACILAEFPK